MDRRTFVSVVGTTGLFGASGCLGTTNLGDPLSENRKTSSKAKPSVDGEQPELSPGTDTTITIKASPITALHFSEIPERAQIEFDVAHDTVSPRPDRAAESYPPQWFWSTPTAVTVDTPVSVAPDAEPGAYSYGITASTGTDTSMTTNPSSPVSVSNTDDTASSDDDASQSVTEQFTITVAER